VEGDLRRRSATAVAAIALLAPVAACGDDERGGVQVETSGTSTGGPSTTTAPTTATERTTTAPAQTTTNETMTTETAP